MSNMNTDTEIKEPTLENILNDIKMKKRIVQNLPSPLTQHMLSQPTQSIQSTTYENEIFYHVLLDCDFPYRNNLGDDFSSKYTGTLKNFAKQNNRTPILYNYEDAKNISRKIISQLIEKGTNKGKRIPIFGALILGFRSNSATVKHTTDDVAMHGAKEYNLILNEENNQTDIITYQLKGFKRGLITKNGIKKSNIVSVSYGYLMDTPINIGLFMLNLLPQFTEDEIRVLRQVLAQNGKPHMLASYVPNATLQKSDSTELSLNTETSDDEISEHKAMIGGNFKKLYKEEKQKYLKLKSIAKNKGLLF